MKDNMVITRCLLWSLLLFFLLILFACKENKVKTDRSKQSYPVICGKATIRQVKYVLHQVGTLKANQEVSLRTEIEGRVTEILFQEGGYTKKGSILVRFNDIKLKAEIKNLEARIYQFQIRLDNKKRALARKKPLVKKDLVSQLQFDDLKAEIKEIEAMIVQSRADMVSQKEILSDMIIRAPFDGFLGARNISVGAYLKKGESVVTVVDLDPLDISFQVPEKYKPDLFTGKQVLLTVDSHPDKVFEGILSFIAPEIDVDTRTFQVKARIKNQENLLNPGMFAKVRVVTGIHKDAITVPWESIIQTEAETYLYMVEGSLARKVSIRLGKVNNQWAEVLGGNLGAENRVILEGKFAVKDGSQITIIKTSEKQKS